MKCTKCGSEKTWVQLHKTYADGSTGTCYRCADCRKYFTIRHNSTDVQPLNQVVPKEGNGRKIGVSLNDIIKTHDVEELLKEGLKKLQKGTLFTEPEFIDLSGLRGKYYRGAIDTPEIKKYKGKIDGVTYWGAPEDIEILREKYIIR
jgi:DNA-directed RNA polymerase subunit RPC12/RpoP